MDDCSKEPALLVGEIDDDIDFKNPPLSGEDYIKRVVIEAQRCDEIVVVEIDKDKLKKQTYDIKTLAGCVKAPAELSPTLEWQQCQIADFSDVRLHIERLKIERKKCPGWKSTSTILPCIDDQIGWMDFCFGSKDREVKAHLPTLDIILSMKPPLIEQVLEYFVEEVEKKMSVDIELGQWLYSLLSVVELPLDPDICSCLRALARACSKIRANLTISSSISDDDRAIATLNLFICLVARYFRQLDLADP
ncbi:hypothetical protein PV325_013455 [Microctonus aethiopoides]|uniref:Gem-associated protein 2 n=1 Tax=Microctonus aethiopoides TaxID=144406 RepID=A0AA39FHH2_9HYME|nr:hypothetical protein PV325_013455 [Microctonus aethiopoides]KAK0169680.1 hypothetical protein PV328_011694 [Microctonus aethiopoides]